MISSNYDFSLDCMHSVYACVLCMYTVDTAHAKGARQRLERECMSACLRPSFVDGGRPLQQ